MASGGQVAVWGSSADTSPNPWHCVPTRLCRVGGAPSGSDGLRGVVSGRDLGTHQHDGNEGSSAASGCLPASVVSAVCHPDER